MWPSTTPVAGDAVGAVDDPPSDPDGARRRRPARRPARGGVEPVRLPGIPITDKRWFEARRGRRPPNFGRTFPKEVLTIEEVVALCGATPVTRPTGLRNRAMLVTMWRSGLRVAEVVDLYPRDVDLRRCTVHVRAGKGAQEGISIIDRQTAELIEQWMAKRAELGIPADRPLFCTVLRDAHVHGELWRSLGEPYVRNLVKRLGKKAGLERRVHPHALRHTMTVELEDAGYPSRIIQFQLRHKRLSSTEIYLRTLSAPELRRQLAPREWPAPAAALLEEAAAG